jgi:hypothetical protein
MAAGWGLWALVFVFASSFALGGVSAYLLVKWAGKTVMWVFAVPFTLWWTVAGLSVAVHVFGVRVTVPVSEPPARAIEGPLTPRSELPLEAMEASRAWTVPGVAARGR